MRLNHCRTKSEEWKCNEQNTLICRGIQNLAHYIGYIQGYIHAWPFHIHLRTLWTFQSETPFHSNVDVTLLTYRAIQGSSWPKPSIQILLGHTFRKKTFGQKLFEKYFRTKTSRTIFFQKMLSNKTFGQKLSNKNFRIKTFE
jgi:hypothetical protein